MRCVILILGHSYHGSALFIFSVVRINEKKLKIELNGLTNAEGFSLLGPIPVSGVVAPSPSLAGEDVLGVAVKLDHGAGREGERGLATVGRRAK